MAKKKKDSENSGLFAEPPVEPQSAAGRLVQEYATRTGVSVEAAVEQILRTPGCTLTCLLGKAQGSALAPVSNIPGHLIGPAVIGPVPLARGPQPARVLVLLSHPDENENRNGSYLMGPHGWTFRELCANVGLDPSSWYVTAAEWKISAGTPE